MPDPCVVPLPEVCGGELPCNPAAPDTCADPAPVLALVDMIMGALGDAPVPQCSDIANPQEYNPLGLDDTQGYFVCIGPQGGVGKVLLGELWPGVYVGLGKGSAKV
jgi:hypothetical protein